jgi:hypothetical protein
MLRALERYDEAAGVPFPALASWWIRNALQELRSDVVRPFRLPPTDREREIVRARFGFDRRRSAWPRSASGSASAPSASVSGPGAPRASREPAWRRGPCRRVYLGSRPAPCSAFSLQRKV